MSFHGRTFTPNAVLCAAGKFFLIAGVEPSDPRRQPLPYYQDAKAEI